VRRLANRFQPGGKCLWSIDQQPDTVPTRQASTRNTAKRLVGQGLERIDWEGT